MKKDYKQDCQNIVSEEALAEMAFLLRELGYTAQARTPILRKILQKNSSYEKQNK